MKSKPVREAKSKPTTKSKPAAVASSPPLAPPHPIVGVGASAGGLDAFSQLVAALPANLGITLVLVQHLQPGHPSLLAKLLQKRTRIPVEDVVDGVTPRPNHIYVMPAGKEMVLKRGRLRLEDRSSDPNEINLPIDLFFRSLASERKSSAIGAVLSGTAADGTQGLMAIKSEGGMCFAQSEASAEYGAMPRNAIASGCVDFVLSPRDMALELARIANHPYLAAHPDAHGAEVLVPEGDHDFKAVLDILRNETGVDFSQYRASTISRRLARRLAVHGMERLSNYVVFLRSHPGEVGLLFEDLLIPATRFFRDPEVFDFLARKVLAPWVRQRRPAGRPLRLWSVGCASGEEAYSLAMLGLEALTAAGESGAVLQVFGTDLNPSAVRRARAGRYGSEIAQDVSPERLKRFFVKADHGYRVAKSLRDVCIFAQHNVAREAPFSHLDVICCRNVMIYMEPVLQRRIFPVLHYALNTGGVLVLGSAESASAAADLFSPFADGGRKESAQRRLKAFHKLPGSRVPHFDLGGLGSSTLASSFAAPHRGQAPASAAEEARRAADKLVLAEYTPAGVIVDAQLDVVEFRGKTSPYLDPAPGPASLNLMRMARGNLGAYVRAAVQKAARTGVPVRQTGLTPGTSNGDLLDLSVSPLNGDSESAKGLFLVLFHSAGRSRPAEGGNGDKPGAKAQPPASRVELTRTKKALVESQQLIRSLADEYHGAKQEYQAATEEIASANEELQSSNEELETSKEELQSANEEISTINEELRHRNAELHQANTDLQNLISIAVFAVVLLDRELRVRRFSPAAEKIFSLIPGDVGRRISDIRASIATAEIESLSLRVFASGGPQQREVQDNNGRWFEMRANPYFAADNKVDGLILAVHDINALKGLSAEIAEVVSVAATNPVAVLDGNLEVVTANPAFRALSAEYGQAIRTAIQAALPKLDTHGSSVERGVSLAKTSRSLRIRSVPGSEGRSRLLVSIM